MSIPPIEHALLSLLGIFCILVFQVLVDFVYMESSSPDITTINRCRPGQLEEICMYDKAATPLLAGGESMAV